MPAQHTPAGSREPAPSAPHVCTEACHDLPALPRVSVDQLRFAAERCEALAGILEGEPLRSVVLDFDGADGTRASHSYEVCDLFASVARLIRRGLGETS